MDQFVKQTEAILIVTNCPDQSTAVLLARHLLEQKLAACVNILPVVQSLYRWQCEIQSESEVGVLIKSTRVCYAQLEQAIKAMHPYDVPEIIALPIIAGSTDYLQWLAQETSKGRDV